MRERRILIFSTKKMIFLIANIYFIYFTFASNCNNNFSIHNFTLEVMKIEEIQI